MLDIYLCFGVANTLLIRRVKFSRKIAKKAVSMIDKNKTNNLEDICQLKEKKYVYVNLHTL